MIDHQWHWLPPELAETLQARHTPPRVQQAEGGWTYQTPDSDHHLPPTFVLELDEQLRAADDHGIDAVVCSAVIAGEVLHLDADEAADVLIEANAAIARAQRDRPDRFVGLAMLPMQDSQAAIEVLDRAVDDGLSGVCMLASIDGQPLATEATLPIFERIEKHGVPVLLHPAIRSNTSHQDLGGRAEIGLGWMYHTALAATQLVVSGTLDACPGLTVLHHHLGGVLPYVLGRLDRLPVAERRVLPYLRKNFYVDTVSATPAALSLAIETYGVDRILFATDYPMYPIEAGVRFVRENAGDGNAVKIFGNILPGLRPRS